MDDKVIDKIAILAKLSAISDIQLKLQQDRNQLEEELREIEEYERKVITIKPRGVSQKQWSNLLLELNLMKRAWKPYGVDLHISAPGLKNIIKWGTKSYGRPE